MPTDRFWARKEPDFKAMTEDDYYSSDDIGED